MDKNRFEKLLNLIKNNSSEWIVDDDEYHYIHRKTGLDIWIAGGFDYLKVKRPVAIECFSFWQRYKLWRAIKKNLEGHKDRIFLERLREVNILIDEM